MARPGNDPSRRTPERDAILHAGVEVIDRQGYAAASLQEIAAAASLSEEQLLAHFAGKQELFTAIIYRVSDDLVTLIEDVLSDVDDLPAAFTQVGLGWARIQVRRKREFSLVQRVRAEAAGTLPDEVLDRWQHAASGRVQHTLTDAMRALARRGLIETCDPERSANQFIWIVLGEASTRSNYGAAPLPEPELRELVTSGVHGFLHGHLPRATTDPATWRR